MKNNNKRTIYYYWLVTKQYKFLFFLIFSSVIVKSLVDIVIPLLYREIFDGLSSGKDVSQTTQMIFATLLMIGGLLFFGWFVQQITMFSLIKFEAFAAYQLAVKCFAYVHKHSVAYFNDSFVGSLVKKVSWFYRSFERIIEQLAFNLLPLLINSFFVVLILGKRNIYLGLGILSWIFFVFLVGWLFARFKNKYDLARNEAETEVTGLLADTFTNHLNIKLFNNYQRELKKFSDKSFNLLEKRKKSWSFHAFFELVQGFLMVILEIGIMFLAIYFWSKGSLSIGDLVLIQTYIFGIMNRIWNFAFVLRSVFEALSDASEMTEILDTPHEVADVLRAKKLQVTRGLIDFEKVSFHYSDTSGSFEVLTDFNLTIPAHQRLAIIGPSGSGKSTIIKLLFRNYNLSRGRIIIDGQDIAKVTQESLWSNVSLVPQDPILFHRTLRENIAYGKPDATEKEIINASKIANCHNFITQLKDGYDTYVGERGVKLSGGERQRVAIARAVLKNAPILVLDEATSSLDSESEKLIQEALEKLMKNKTVIVIAHRLSTIRKMDRIIVLDNGRIIEDGNHEVLLNNKTGLYKKLWGLQSGGFIA